LRVALPTRSPNERTADPVVGKVFLFPSYAVRIEPACKPERHALADATLAKQLDALNANAMDAEAIEALYNSA